MAQTTLYKKGLWRSYLFSFIAVFLTCSIITISSFYILVDKLLKDEVTQFSLNLVSQVKDTMDMRIEELYNLAYQISLDKGTQKLLYVGKPFETDSLLSMPELITKLSAYRDTNNFVSNIAIYYSSNDSVVTIDGRYDTDYFFKNYANYGDISKEELLKMLEQPQNKCIIPLQGISGEYNLNGKYITYMQSLPIGDNNPSATIMFFIDKNSMLNMMAKHMTDDIGQVQIFTTDGKLIASKDEQFLLDKRFRESMKGSQKTFYMEDSYETKKIISFADSDLINWNYVAILNLEYTIKKAEQIRNITSLIVFICCFVGITMSFIMAKFSYKPWKALMNNIEGLLLNKKTYAESKNEYAYVDDTIKAIINEREKIQFAFDQNKKYAKHYILQKICEGEKISVEDLLNNKIEFPYKYFSVVTLKVKEEVEKLNIIFSSLIMQIDNVLTSNKEPYKIVAFYDQNNVLHFILNMDYTQEQAYLKQLEEVRGMVKKFIEAPIALGVGTIYDDISFISVSYQEARKALEYSILSENNCITYYWELPEISSNILDIPIDARKRLYSCVKSGDFDGAAEIMDIYFKKLLDKDKVPVYDIYYVYFNILNTAIEICNDMHIDVEEGCKQKKERLLNVYEFKNVNHAIKNLYTAYSSLCDYIFMENERNKNILSDHIEQYIRVNFRDKGLCSTDVAENLNISGSYLSRYMSKKFGMGFGDYLNNVRLSHAKSLLIDSSKTVSEIASEVGYTSTSSFIRTFKRLEGITPGQFKG